MISGGEPRDNIIVTYQSNDISQCRENRDCLVSLIQTNIGQYYIHKITMKPRNGEECENKN